MHYLSCLELIYTFHRQNIVATLIFIGALFILSALGILKEGPTDKDKKYFRTSVFRCNANLLSIRSNNPKLLHQLLFIVSANRYFFLAQFCNVSIDRSNLGQVDDKGTMNT